MGPIERIIKALLADALVTVLLFLLWQEGYPTVLRFILIFAARFGFIWLLFYINDMHGNVDNMSGMIAASDKFDKETKNQTALNRQDRILCRCFQ